MKQSKREKFKSNNIYGDGKAAVKIVNFLKNKLGSNSKKNSLLA